jgi:hypothetical protein
MLLCKQGHWWSLQMQSTQKEGRQKVFTEKIKEAQVILPCTYGSLYFFYSK